MAVKTKDLRKIKGLTAKAPLTERQLQRELKPRAALKSAKGIRILYDLPTVASGKLRKIADRSKKGRFKDIRLQLQVAPKDFGKRVFPPPITGTKLKASRDSKKTRAKEKLGLPELDGFLPDHLPLNPIPPKLKAAERIPKFTGKLPKRRSKDLHLATTVFSPDDRYLFNDTSFPWCTIGRVDTALGMASGVLIGPRHLLTVSHVIQWLSGNSCGWVRYRPSYYNGNAPFGEAWATRWYAYKKVLGPTINRSEGRQDYVVLVLDRRIGDVCGWMGSKTYSDSWDGANYWRHIGYPGDLATGERPSYERDIALDGSFWDAASHQRIWHRGDVWRGQSGGPFFAWWSGESWPRVVAVQSGENSSENSASGGRRMVRLIQRARDEHS